MSTEKIDMGLDDIIRLERRSKAARGKAPRGRGRGAGANAKGVSPLNRGQTHFGNAATNGQGRGRATRGVQGSRGRGGKRGMTRGMGGTRGGITRGMGGSRGGRGASFGGRGGNRVTGSKLSGRQYNTAQTGKRRQQAYTSTRGTARQQQQTSAQVIRARNTSRQQQQQRQRQGRQNTMNRQRGIQNQNQQTNLTTKVGLMHSDQILAQRNSQRKRQWGRTSVQNSDNIMTISVDNTNKNSDVDVIVGGNQNRTRPRINRGSPRTVNNDVQMMVSPKRVRPRIRRRSDVQVMVDSPRRMKPQINRQSSSGMQVLVTPQQNQHQQHQKKKQPQHQQQTKQVFHATVVSPSHQKQTMGQNKRNNRRKKNNNAVNSPVPEESTPLQQQLKNLVPTVKHDYQFNRQDFGKATTTQSMNERFSRSVAYTDPSVPSSSIGRQVFF